MEIAAASEDALKCCRDSPAPGHGGAASKRLAPISFSMAWSGYGGLAQWRPPQIGEGGYGLKADVARYGSNVRFWVDSVEKVGWTQFRAQISLRCQGIFGINC
jgi:hypothetical protein